MRAVIVGGIYLVAVLISFYIGYATGMHEVRTSTIVHVGSPRYTAGPFFGECAQMGDQQACATDNPPWVDQK